MRKSLLLLLLFPALTRAQTLPVTVSGTVFNAGGTPAKSGTVTFRIQPQSSSLAYTVPGIGAIAPQLVVCAIQSNGQLKNQDSTGPCTVWGNDVISPANTTYQMALAPGGLPTNTISQICMSGSTFSINAPVFCPVVSIVPQYNTITSPQISSNLVPSAPNVFTLGNSQAQYQSSHVQSEFVYSGLYVGTNASAQGLSPSVTIGPQAPMTSSWILDLTTPQTAYLSICPGSSCPTGGGGGSGSPVLPSASGTWEAVLNGNIDNTGTADVSAALNAQLATLCNSGSVYRVHLPTGIYKINSGLVLNASASACRGIVIEGDGPSNTILRTNCATGQPGIWFNNAAGTPGSGVQSMQGLTLTNLMVANTGGASCTEGVRLTQMAMGRLDHLTVTGFIGQPPYTTGTISTLAGAFIGSGTTFTQAMVHGFIEVTGGTATTRSEICSITDATHGNLCQASWPGGNLTNSAYAIVYGGRGITCDPGNSYTQYVTISDSWIAGNLIGYQALGSTTGGCSAIWIYGGEQYTAPNPGSRIADSVGYFIGQGSDTHYIWASVNNVTACWVLNSVHGADIHGRCENSPSPSYSTVTTCAGGASSRPCTQALEASSDTNGHGWNNVYRIYAHQVGTVFRFDNAQGANDAYIGWDQVYSAAGFDTHFDFYGTTGCPANASGVPARIDTYDCNHSLVAQTVN